MRQQSQANKLVQIKPSKTSITKRANGTRQKTISTIPIHNYSYEALGHESVIEKFKLFWKIQKK